MRRWGGAFFATAVALLACSSCLHGSIFADDGAFFAGGSRLRPMVQEVAGVRLLVGWYDTALNKPCAFDDRINDPDPDGIYTCAVPLGAHATDFGPFLDASCTEPLASVPPDETLPYVRIRPIDSCEHGVAFHAAGEPVRARPFVKVGRDCVPDPDPRVRSFVRVGERADPPFVHAKEIVAPRGGRIDAVVRIAEDGSKEVVGAWDRDRAEPVRAYWTTDRNLRWLPVREAFGHGTGHSSCSGIASKIRHNAICPITVVTTVATSGACGVSLHEIGRRLQGPELEARCATDATADDLLFFETGGVLADDAFALATRIEIGRGRIRTRAYAATGSSAILGKSFFDAETGEECLVVKALDGKERCLPAPIVVRAFTDSACTLPAAQDTSFGCDALRPGGAVRVSGTDDYGAYVVLPDHVDVYERRGAQCVKAGMGYALREIPPEALPLAFELREE